MLKARMPALLCVSLFLGVGVFVVAEDLAMQTGTWEFRMTGFPMDGAPPAMRAQMEAEMSKPYRSCVTADDIKQLKFGRTNDDDEEDCKVVSSTLTRTGGDVVRQCTGDEPSTENLRLEALTPQTMKATITKKTGAKSTTMPVTGRWLNARCIDQNQRVFGPFTDDPEPPGVSAIKTAHITELRARVSIALMHCGNSGSVVAQLCQSSIAATTELCLRSRKSLFDLQKPFDLLLARPKQENGGVDGTRAKRRARRDA